MATAHKWATAVGHAASPWGTAPTAASPGQRAALARTGPGSMQALPWGAGLVALGGLASAAAASLRRPHRSG